jgi:uncharacterized protein YcgL (UPF0745 family)
MKKISTIYRSPKKEGMYLYVEKAEDLARVPDALLKQFGKPEQAMTLLLHADRVLARVDVKKVMAAIDEQGYFLQMPPQPDTTMAKIHLLNTKM